MSSYGFKFRPVRMLFVATTLIIIGTQSPWWVTVLAGLLTFDIQAVDE